MTRQDFANVIALPLWQARRDQPVQERLRGIPDYEIFNLPDAHLDGCLLPAVDEALNKERV
jgi:hypothetical protein